MGKKTIETQTDIDLADLYATAKKGKDFSEMARALELRIKYESNKQKGGGAIRASGFDDEGED
jgi:hypothetical protein